LREDPNKPGLLFAGTEQAFMFPSTMDSWQKLNLNLPLTYDLRIQKREKDLIVATHGRALGIR
jgi:hypothetical protein